jgi:uncharacterized protein YnzC (UPF0291/DUF896 family)
MITPELIARINELSRQKRSTGLTPAELAEQQHLRSLYLANIRSQVKGMLDNIEVVDAPAPDIQHTAEAAFALRRKMD